jgi:hypothetical protein
MIKNAQSYHHVQLRWFGGMNPRFVQGTGNGVVGSDGPMQGSGLVDMQRRRRTTLQCQYPYEPTTCSDTRKSFLFQCAELGKNLRTSSKKLAGAVREMERTVGKRAIRTQIHLLLGIDL